MRYKVIDKETMQDVTGEQPWVITPDGRLGYLWYDTLREDDGVRCKLCSDKRFNYEMVN